MPHYQLHHFSDGSCVEHGVRLEGSNCRFSVWWDAWGTFFTDAERIDSRGRSYPVTYKQHLQLIRRSAPNRRKPAGIPNYGD